MKQDNEIYTLYCLPSAGSSASMYHPWQNLAPTHFRIKAIDYPGHGSRITEALIQHPGNLINDIADTILATHDQTKDIVLFGHSLGAGLLPFVAQKIQKESTSQHIALMVISGRGYRSKTRATQHELDDQNALLNFLQRYEGIPAALLTNQEALDFFFPIIKNDILLNNALLRLHSEMTITTTPLLVFSGAEDRNVTLETLNEWRHLTNQWRGVEFFEGGHFYLSSTKNISAMLKSILTHLQRPNYTD
ncbi:Thioesterase PikA5 [Oligella sp. MSHR50489EDL]|uniref:thioesterase II family protein n=1 Tax=Oligella sp. MSHR50489EDL TaxID=3139409 RepID=UPI003D817723